MSSIASGIQGEEEEESRSAQAKYSATSSPSLYGVMLRSQIAAGVVTRAATKHHVAAIPMRDCLARLQDPDVSAVCGVQTTTTCSF